MQTYGVLLNDASDRQVAQSSSSVIGSFRGSVDLTLRPDSPSSKTTVEARTDGGYSVQTACGSIDLPTESTTLASRSAQLFNPTLLELVSGYNERVALLAFITLQAIPPLLHSLLAPTVLEFANHIISEDLIKETAKQCIIQAVLEEALKDAKTKKNALDEHLSTLSEVLKPLNQAKTALDNATQQRDETKKNLIQTTNLRANIQEQVTIAAATGNTLAHKIALAHLIIVDEQAKNILTQYIEAENLFTQASLLYINFQKTYQKELTDYDSTLEQTAQAQAIVDAIQSALETHQGDNTLSNEADGELLTAVSAIVSDPRQDFTNPLST